MMQCPHYEADRSRMYSELQNIHSTKIEDMFHNPRETYLALMGKHPPDMPFDVMLPVWIISSKHISAIYKKALIVRYLN